MKLNALLVTTVLAATVVGCSSLMLRPADFSWPVESVLKADAKGMVQENRYQLSFSIKPLVFEETGDSSNVSGMTIRVIRDQLGYYFIAAPRFKNVYVFAAAEGGLKLEKKIMISESGMGSPAFNARPPHVQLLNGSEKPLLLSKNGIQEGAKP